MQIGIIGAGMIGGTVGRLWAKAGHKVRFATRHPDELRDLVKGVPDRPSVRMQSALKGSYWAVVPPWRVVVRSMHCIARRGIGPIPRLTLCSRSLTAPP
jgi:hypothetical protein